MDGKKEMTAALAFAQPSYVAPLEPAHYFLPDEIDLIRAAAATLKPAVRVDLKALRLSERDGMKLAVSPRGVGLPRNQPQEVEDLDEAAPNARELHF